MREVIDFLISHPVISTLVLIFGAIGLVEFWAFRIRPLFIPKVEIDSVVDELIARHGPRAEEIAYINEDRAWRYSDTFEQGKWRRVRRELWRRYEAGEWE